MRFRASAREAKSPRPGNRIIPASGRTPLSSKSQFLLLASKTVEKTPKLLGADEAIMHEPKQPQQQQKHNQEDKHILDSHQEQQTSCVACSLHFRIL